MKKITKEASPAWFEAWKKDFKSTKGREAHYKNDFSSDNADGTARRQKLRGQLIKEQGHICCYCMKRIFLNNSHIEHFWPKAFFPHIDLEYNNMFASCNGDGVADFEGHCGHKKEDWWEKEMISPTDITVEGLFRYTADGKIHSAPRKPTTNIAREMIIQMGLDSYHLIRNRREAIQNSEFCDDEDYSSEDIRDFINYYSNKDSGTYVPYCMAIVDCLKEQLDG